MGQILPRISQKKVNPANTLILGFHHLELWDNAFLLFCYLICGTVCGKLTQTPPVQMQAPLRQMAMALLHLRAQQHLGMSEGCCQQEVSERRAKPHFQGISPALWPRLTAIHGYCRREVSTRYCRDSWAMQEKQCSPRCTLGSQSSTQAPLTEVPMGAGRDQETW